VLVAGGPPDVAPLPIRPSGPRRRRTCRGYSRTPTVAGTCLRSVRPPFHRPRDRAFV